MVFPGLSNTSQTKYEVRLLFQSASVDRQLRCFASVSSRAAEFELSHVEHGDHTQCLLEPGPCCSGRRIRLHAGPGCPGGRRHILCRCDHDCPKRTDRQRNTWRENVIILLSDGDANAKSSNMPSGKASNQCHAAISAAQAAAAAGTWVYSLAYGAPTGQTPSSCSTNSPAISACQTMQKIASDPSKFYSDLQNAKNGCSAGVQSISDLVSVFKSVAVSLLPPRLLSNS